MVAYNFLQLIVQSRIISIKTLSCQALLHLRGRDKSYCIRGNLHLPGRYSHSPMKKNNMYRLVNKFNFATKKAACMRMATAARKTCSFFFGAVLPDLIHL